MGADVRYFIPDNTCDPYEFTLLVTTSITYSTLTTATNQYTSNPFVELVNRAMLPIDSTMYVPVSRDDVLNALHEIGLDENAIRGSELYDMYYFLFELLDHDDGRCISITP